MIVLGPDKRIYKQIRIFSGKLIYERYIATVWLPLPVLIPILHAVSFYDKRKDHCVCMIMTTQCKK